MPFVRIDLLRGKPAQHRKTIGEIVYQAMRDVIDVPEGDKFQVITEHAAEELNIAESYLGNRYSKDIVLIQITLNVGRTLDQKRALYRAIAEKLAKKPGLRREDVLVSLVEVPKENWSFGNGEMSYVKD